MMKLVLRLLLFVLFTALVAGQGFVPRWRIVDEQNDIVFPRGAGTFVLDQTSIDLTWSDVLHGRIRTDINGEVWIDFNSRDAGDILHLYDAGGTSVVLSLTENIIIASKPILGTDGAVGGPAFSFSDDTNTGIYSPAAEQLAISTTGVQRSQWDSSGLKVNNLTATRLVSSSASSYLASVSDLTAWIAGGAGITVANDGDGTVTVQSSSGSNVVGGPASSTDHAISRWDGSSGDLLQDSVGILTDAGALSGVTALTLNLTQDALLTANSSNLAIQGQSSATGFGVDVFSSDGDGTDVTAISIYGKSTPGSTTNHERLTLRWDTTSDYEIATEADGTGTLRPLVIFTEGNTDQLKLATDGNVSVSSLTASRLMASDASKNLSSVADLTTWVAGGAGITVADDGDGTLTVSTDGSEGDVSGPGSSTDHAIARWNSTSGNSLLNSTVTIADGGLLTVSATGEMLRLDDTSATGSPYIYLAQAGTQRSFFQHLDTGDELKLASEYGNLAFYTGSAGAETKKLEVTNDTDTGTTQLWGTDAAVDDEDPLGRLRFRGLEYSGLGAEIRGFSTQVWVTSGATPGGLDLYGGHNAATRLARFEVGANILDQLTYADGGLSARNATGGVLTGYRADVAIDADDILGYVKFQGQEYSGIGAAIRGVAEVDWTTSGNTPGYLEFYGGHAAGTRLAKFSTTQVIFDVLLVLENGMRASDATGGVLEAYRADAAIDLDDILGYTRYRGQEYLGIGAEIRGVASQTWSTSGATPGHLEFWVGHQASIQAMEMNSNASANTSYLTLRSSASTGGIIEAYRADAAIDAEDQLGIARFIGQEYGGIGGEIRGKALNTWVTGGDTRGYLEIWVGHDANTEVVQIKNTDVAIYKDADFSMTVDVTGDLGLSADLNMDDGTNGANFNLCSTGATWADLCVEATTGNSESVLIVRPSGTGDKARVIVTSDTSDFSQMAMEAFSDHSKLREYDDNNLVVTIGSDDAMTFSGGAGTPKIKLHSLPTTGASVGLSVNSSDQIVKDSSSARYKRDVRDLGSAADIMRRLRAVSYRWIDSDDRMIPRIGLIAEEVAQVAPGMVAFGQDGKPEAVDYSQLTVLLLKQLQEVGRRLAAMEKAR